VDQNVASLELDHVFICVEETATAEHMLSDFGIQFGLRAVHGGQGTANACAFFDNAYLELLSPHDDRELQSTTVRPLALWERIHWRQTGASPFGIAFRSESVEPAFNTWPYEAPFLPPGNKIPIVTAPNAAHEPLLFLILATLPIRLGSPDAHRGRHRRLTRVGVSRPRGSELPGDVRSLCARSVLQIWPASEHRLDLEWDSGGFGESHDFRPTLPLVLRW
jgi:Glyoxalase-like domain